MLEEGHFSGRQELTRSLTKSADPTHECPLWVEDSNVTPKAVGDGQSSTAKSGHSNWPEEDRVRWAPFERIDLRQLEVLIRRCRAGRERECGEDESGKAEGRSHRVASCYFRFKWIRSAIRHRLLPTDHSRMPLYAHTIPGASVEPSGALDSDVVPLLEENVGRCVRLTGSLPRAIARINAGGQVPRPRDRRAASTTPGIYPSSCATRATMAANSSTGPSSSRASRARASSRAT